MAAGTRCERPSNAGLDELDVSEVKYAAWRWRWVLSSGVRRGLPVEPRMEALARVVLSEKKIDKCASSCGLQRVCEP